MNKQILFFVFSLWGGLISAQSPVTGLPNQWSSIYGYESIQFSNGNHLYLGGRSSQGPITWNAYPGTSIDNFRFRYSNVDAAQLVYIPWNGHFSFQVSDNSPSYSGLVTWRPVLTVSRWNAVDVNANLNVNDGNIVITNNGVNEFKVDVNGNVRCREVQIDLAPIPDYVFAPDYKLMPLSELQNYINKEKHLPGVPSAAEYEKRGEIALGEMNRILLEKVEELTLYTLQLEAQMKALQAQMQALQSSDNNNSSTNNK